MTSKTLKTAVVLSCLVAALAALAALGGLLWPELYRDNAFVRATWWGNDLVTLCLAAPLLVVAMILSPRQSPVPRLAWLGALDYMLYNYAFYLFGAAFNALFLLYAALFSLTIFALLFTALSLDGAAYRLTPGAPIRWISSYFFFVAGGLSLVYVLQSLAFVFTGELPSIVTASGHPTSLVFALDLTLLVPWLVLGGAWLIKRNPWGVVIGGALSVKGPLYTLVLSLNTWVAHQRGLVGLEQMPLWVALTLLGLLAGLVLFKNLYIEKETIL